jgi:hypothetical protein
MRNCHLHKYILTPGVPTPPGFKESVLACILSCFYWMWLENCLAFDGGLSINTSLIRTQSKNKHQFAWHGGEPDKRLWIWSHRINHGAHGAHTSNWTRNPYRDPYRNRCRSHIRIRTRTHTGTRAGTCRGTCTGAHTGTCTESCTGTHIGVHAGTLHILSNVIYIFCDFYMLCCIGVYMVCIIFI